MRRIHIGWLLAATLAGCDEQGSGGLTADESRRLDEAAKMLDEGNPAANSAVSAEPPATAD